MLNDDDLQRYDPTLHALLAQVYGDRHRLPGDVFYRHPARIPPGDSPKATAEIC